MDCEICFEPYSWDATARDKSHLPTSSQKCSHAVCYGCILKTQVAQTQSTGKVPKWLICPTCRAKTSFCPSKPIWNLPLCKVLESTSGRGGGEGPTTTARRRSPIPGTGRASDSRLSRSGESSSAPTKRKNIDEAARGRTSSSTDVAERCSRGVKMEQAETKVNLQQSAPTAARRAVSSGRGSEDGTDSSGAGSISEGVDDRAAGVIGRDVNAATTKMEEPQAGTPVSSPARTTTDVELIPENPTSPVCVSEASGSKITSSATGCAHSSSSSRPSVKKEEANTMAIRLQASPAVAECPSSPSRPSASSADDVCNCVPGGIGEENTEADSPRGISKANEKEIVGPKIAATSQSQSQSTTPSCSTPATNPAVLPGDGAAMAPESDDGLPIEEEDKDEQDATAAAAEADEAFARMRASSLPPLPPPRKKKKKKRGRPAPKSKSPEAAANAAANATATEATNDTASAATAASIAPSVAALASSAESDEPPAEVEREEAARVESLRRVGLRPRDDVDDDEKAYAHGGDEHSLNDDDGGRGREEGHGISWAAESSTAAAAAALAGTPALSNAASGGSVDSQAEQLDAGGIGRKRKRTGELRSEKSLLGPPLAASSAGTPPTPGGNGNNDRSGRNGGKSAQLDLVRLPAPRQRPGPSRSNADDAAASGSTSVSFRPLVLTVAASASDTSNGSTPENVGLPSRRSRGEAIRLSSMASYEEGLSSEEDDESLLASNNSDVDSESSCASWWSSGCAVAPESSLSSRASYGGAVAASVSAASSDSESTPSTASSRNVTPKVGMRVKGLFADENWYHGTIVAVRPWYSTSGGETREISTIAIHYDDGDKGEETYPGRDIILLPEEDRPWASSDSELSSSGASLLGDDGAASPSTFATGSESTPSTSDRPSTVFACDTAEALASNSKSSTTSTVDHVAIPDRAISCSRIDKAIKIKLEEVESAYARASDRGLVSKERERRSALRRKFLLDPSTPNTGRRVFRRGCHSHCLTTVLGGSGTHPFPILSRNPPSLGEGRRPNSFTKEGEFYFAGRSDWNPWTPLFPGDSGLLEAFHMDDEARTGQNEFHCFQHCPTRRDHPGYLGRDAAGGRLYLGKYRRVPEDEAAEVQEVSRSFLYSQLGEESKRTMAYGFRKCQAHLKSFLLQRHVDEAKAIAGCKWDGLSEDWRETETWMQMLLDIEYRIDIVPVEFVSYDEDLYRELCRVGADNGGVSTNEGELGPL